MDFSSVFSVRGRQPGRFFNTQFKRAPAAIIHRQPYPMSPVDGKLTNEFGFMKIFELTSETVPVGYAFQISGASKLNVTPNLLVVSPKASDDTQKPRTPKLVFSGVNFHMYVDEESFVATLMTDKPVIIDVANAN